MLKLYSLDNIDEVAGDLIKGWQLSVTMMLRTPLKWLQRHGEFHEGSKRPAEKVPPEHAIWIFVLKPWRELGIDADEIPHTTMASQIGQIPVDGGDFLPFLLEYRIIVEDGGGTLENLSARYPKYKDLLFPPPKLARKKRRANPSTWNRQKDSL
jgi:hypothetical protein